jgi:hypothetical protein
MILRISGQSDSPVRLPCQAAALLVFWHGGPPTMRSVEPAAPQKVRTSSWIGTSGKCLRITRRRQGSISTKLTVRNPPVAWRPRAWPPMQEKRSSERIIG